MKAYELTYIISSEISSEEAEAKAREIESLVQGKEGIIVKQVNPVAKTLAHPVAGRASGFFGVLEFQLEPENLAEIKEVVAKDKKIIRHMVIIKEPVRIRKERRTRKTEEAPAFTIEQKTEEKSEPKTEKTKVELKDIEEQLDEILG